MGLRWSEVYEKDGVADYEDPPHGVLDDEEDDYYIGDNPHYDPTPDDAYLTAIEADDRNEDETYIGGIRFVRGHLVQDYSASDVRARMNIHHPNLTQQARSKEDAVSKRALLEARAARALKELEQYEAYGEDVYEDDMVLLFKYKYRNGSQVYVFAALKIKGYWYLSGRSSSKFSWDDLVKFWMDGELVELWEADGWTEVKFK